MTNEDVANWMVDVLAAEGCLYQDDVVDFLVKANQECLLTENNDGNQVLSKAVLDAFKKLTPNNVVWIRSGFYWRYRVAEDEPGRNARG
ncbi:DUF6953 family protein [Pantoea ananatis]|uniref:DUF6953 family protein n=1 Tax=Pantoea ananas TaxID=553 RepID=UPI003FA48402